MKLIHPQDLPPSLSPDWLSSHQMAWLARAQRRQRRLLWVIATLLGVIVGLAVWAVL